VGKIGSDGLLRVIAGNGIPAFSGDGGTATNAALYGPQAATADTAGNVYIADAGNQRIRKVAPDGTITTIAAGLCLSQQAPLPIVSVAVDGAGGVLYGTGSSFINQEAVVCRVSTDGSVTLFAGGGTTPRIDGANGRQALDITLANGAILIDPTGAVDVIDRDRVLKIGSDGKVLTIFGLDRPCSGPGVPSSGSCDIGPGPIGDAVNAAFDSAGNLYVADLGAQYINVPPEPRIVKVDVSGTVSIFAGSGSTGFSGDGSLATQAQLSAPYAVVSDYEGNVYIAEAGNQVNSASIIEGGGRIRKVTGSGIIDSIAGNGQFRRTGDGGPATAATLFNPAYGAVAVDGHNNVYLSDSYNHVVRKVTEDGIISTIAGTGIAGFSGDGGPAIRAQLNLPAGIAVDRQGNVYVAELGNLRLRKINVDGMIDTVTTGRVENVTADNVGNVYFNGNGMFRVRLDGTIESVTLPAAFNIPQNGNSPIASGPNGNLYFVARSRPFDDEVIRLNSDGSFVSYDVGDDATGLTVDQADNVYVSTLRGTVLRISPDGTKLRYAGAATFGLGFSGDGGQATEARFRGISALAVDAFSNLFIVDSGNLRVRVVLSTPPAVEIAPATLAFTGQASGRLPSAQAITIVTSVPQLPFEVNVSTSDAGNWILADISSGVSPRLVEITVNPFGMPPGSYSGRVTIQIPLGRPSSFVIPVALTVTPSVAPSLALDRSSFAFTFPSGSSARSETVRVLNIGGGSLDFMAKSVMDSGYSWLSATPTNGTAIPSAPAPLLITADPAGLGAGSYTANIIVSGVSIPDEVQVPVSMTISANPSAFLLSQTGLSFLAIQHGGVVPPASFGIQNLGAGSLPISVETSTLSGGSWLTASLQPSITGPQLVNVVVNGGDLETGKYYGLVKVQSSGAANTPQLLTSMIDVLPQGTDLGAVLQPNEITFNAATGGESPGSQVVLVFNPTGRTKSFRTSALPPWLIALPLDGTVKPDAPTPVTIQPITYGLAAGTYLSKLTLQFDDGRVRTIGITLVVTGSSSSSSSPQNRAEGLADTCMPTELLPRLRSLGNDFSVPAGWPVSLLAQVEDDCGKPFESGTVVAEFSNGDPPLRLNTLSAGLWDTTWQPRHSQSRVAVTLSALSSDGEIKGSRQIAGGFSMDEQPPMIAEDSIVDAASVTPLRALAPGTLISIFGERLADQSVPAAQVPYPTMLATTGVLIHGELAPLMMVDAPQVNAIIPYGIEQNTRQQILVLRGNTYSQPVPFTVVAASPAIFVTGNGRTGAIVDANGKLITPDNPAKHGDLINIFCTGLGEVQPVISAGDHSPASSLPTTPVTVSIGGSDATVKFAGLAPGLVALYLIQAIIPDNVAGADDVPVIVISHATPSVASPPVALSVR
jgi:uncharacterized protein (TIGR03437 family)